MALLREFGWSRSLAAGAFSVFVIVHSVTGPFVGGMVDRFGPRRVILLGSLFLGMGLALCSLTSTWWHYHIFFGAVTAVGVGSIGWVPHTSMASSSVWAMLQRQHPGESGRCLEGCIDPSRSSSLRQVAANTSSSAPDSGEGSDSVLRGKTKRVGGRLTTQSERERGS